MSSSSSSSGIGLAGLLTVAFVVLKLCDVIAWSWWWVLSPLWIGVALFVVALILLFCFLPLIAVGRAKFLDRLDKMLD